VDEIALLERALRYYGRQPGKWEVICREHLPHREPKVGWAGRGVGGRAAVGGCAGARVSGLEVKARGGGLLFSRSVGGMARRESWGTASRVCLLQRLALAWPHWTDVLVFCPAHPTLPEPRC